MTALKQHDLLASYLGALPGNLATEFAECLKSAGISVRIRSRKETPQAS